MTRARRMRSAKGETWLIGPSIPYTDWGEPCKSAGLQLEVIQQTGPAALVISRDYISHGLRSRAANLVAAEIGLKPEQEIRSALARKAAAKRWTRLDMDAVVSIGNSARTVCDCELSDRSQPRSPRSPTSGSTAERCQAGRLRRIPLALPFRRMPPLAGRLAMHLSRCILERPY
jgi:hypothetical protein